MKKIIAGLIVFLFSFGVVGSAIACGNATSCATFICDSDSYVAFIYDGYSSSYDGYKDGSSSSYDGYKDDSSSYDSYKDGYSSSYDGYSSSYH